MNGGALVIRSLLSPADLDLLKTFFAGHASRHSRALTRGYDFLVVLPNDLRDLRDRLAPHLGDTVGRRTDSFFLRYRTGDQVAPHVDKRTERRVNVLVTKPTAGGIFSIEGVPVPLEEGDAVIFESRRTHSVSRCESERVIFSVGMIRDGYR